MFKIYVLLIMFIEVRKLSILIFYLILPLSNGAGCVGETDVDSTDDRLEVTAPDDELVLGSVSFICWVKDEATACRDGVEGFTSFPLALTRTKSSRTLNVCNFNDNKAMPNVCLQNYY